jgi:hypothetical protein
VGRATGRLAVALAVVGLVLLAGCTTIRGLIDTENALGRAGFTEVDVNFSSNNGFDQVEVGLRPPSRELTDTDADAREAARVVWTTFPLRFDLLRLELLGPGQPDIITYTYSELEEILGPRPPGLDDKELGDDVVRAGVGVAVVLAIGGLLFTVAVVLAIVFGLRASRRRKSVVPPPWPPAPR